MSDVKQTAFNIRLKFEDNICGFWVDLPIDPSPNEYINFTFDDGDLSTIWTSRIEHVTHLVKLDYIQKLVYLHSFDCDSYDHLLRMLDLFKCHPIYDIEASVEPKPYYVLYRSVIEIMDLKQVISPIINTDSASVKLFAELCRSAIMSVFYDLADINHLINIPHWNKSIEDLHKIILSQKQASISSHGQLPIIPIIKEWEAVLNPKQDNMWDTITLEKSQAIACIVFKKLHSIPFKLMPKFLQQHLGQYLKDSNDGNLWSYGGE